MTNVVIPKLMVLCHQPMGAMFPTADLFTIVIHMITVKLMDWQITCDRIEETYSSLLSDNRSQWLPILLYGDEVICTLNPRVIGTTNEG